MYISPQFLARLKEWNVAYAKAGAKAKSCTPKYGDTADFTLVIAELAVTVSVRLER